MTRAERILKAQAPRSAGGLGARSEFEAEVRVDRQLYEEAGPHEAVATRSTALFCGACGAHVLFDPDTLRPVHSALPR